MLTIRLQRTGTKNRPSFRLVLAEAQKAAGKKFQEVLGNYNPVSKVFGIKNEERLKYWIEKNVRLSPTVHNLLVEKKFIDKKKVKAWRPKIKEGVQTPTVAAATPAAETAPAAAETAPEAPTA